jgi:hypothetical protein
MVNISLQITVKLWYILPKKILFNFAIFLHVLAIIMQSILNVTCYSACSANYLMMVMESQVYKMFRMNQFNFKKLS